MGKFRLPRFWDKYIATLVIFTLLVSQTIRVDFFDDAGATPEQYRDVVSIFVDKETYSDIGSKVRRYASDVESYLSATRVSIFVVDKDTPPAVIAARNEKLYYEGDGGEGTSHLVGTVLIGDIALPMVGHDGDFFPSIYPYVDFDDKEFVYQKETGRYESPTFSVQKQAQADIWHGVINPSVGRTWNDASDIQKISQFLDKTHEFYTKSGKFTPSNIPPRVFYYDGFSESKSVSLKSLFQYALSMQNSENIAYSRFTKYLLTDLNRAVDAYDETNDTETRNLLESLGIDPGKDTLDAEAFAQVPDIQTETPILALLKDFSSIFNKKTLGDAFTFVHNAGRYNSGSTVRADLGPLSMTLMDTIARSTLFEANNALMDSFEKTIQEKKIAKRIPIFDSVQTGNSTNSNAPKSYTNYFFGQKASTLQSPAICSIARGSSGTITQFGRDVLVEANVAYDIGSTQGHIDKLKKDTDELVALHKNQAYSCFETSGKAKLDSYWGGNSILRVSGAGADATTLLTGFPEGTRLMGMSESIFSLAGMKETRRMSSNTIADCLSPQYQYALAEPYTYTYTVVRNLSSETCRSGSPREWTKSNGPCVDDIGSRTPRYTCLTEHTLLPTVPNFTNTLEDYTNRACYSGTLTLDGVVLQTANRACSNATTYESFAFHTIPSILRHASPTLQEIEVAKKSQMTPSLPVDIKRYVEFLTPKGNIARTEYPNFFEAPATDIASLRAWLTQISQSEWQKIIAAENALQIDQKTVNANQYLSATTASLVPLDWNDFLSDAVLQKVLSAKSWLTPDVTTKYKKAIETSLSYSREYASGTISPPKLPNTSGGYEVAYLGLSPFLPNALQDDETNALMNDYALSMREIEGINIAQTDGGDESPENSTSAKSDLCGPPEGVDLFKWPQAILCWIKSLTPPRIIGGTCSTNTIGMSETSSSLSRPSPAVSVDPQLLADFYTGGKLTYAIPRNTLFQGDTLEGEFRYTKNNQILDLPASSSVELKIVSANSPSGLIPQDRFSDILSIAPNVSPVIDGKAKFLLRAGNTNANVGVQGVLTLRFPDGSERTFPSESIDLKITDEYLDVVTKIADEPTTLIPVTSATGVTFDISVQNASGTVSPVRYPVFLDVYDDISGNMVASGLVMQNPEFSLPQSITKTLGSYRLELRDSLGRSASQTLAVTAGELARVNVVPISSSIVKGSNTLAYIRLSDRLGNPTRPDLHSIDVEVSGGYILLSSGVKQTKMRIDAMESEIPLLLASDTPGNIKIRVNVDASIANEKEIRVLERAKLLLTRPSIPRVGGAPMPIDVKIVDETNNPIVGFNSVATLEIAESAGKFSPEVITIENGVAKDVVFTPGRQSGEHRINATIPGIGTISDIQFSLDTGLPMYISHTETGSLLNFFLADRYGNMVKDSLTGSLVFNKESTQNIAFSNGIFSTQKKGGYYTIRVPSVANNAISIQQGTGTYTVSGIPHYATYISGNREKFDFLPDYNARYTVLAGGEFLREAEQILYGTTPGLSQSLAVSTLLDSPYEKKTLLSILPSGGFTLGNTDTSLVEGGISLQDGYPLVSFSERISSKTIARVLYKGGAGTEDFCSAGSKDCLSDLDTKGHIQLLLASGGLLQGGEKSTGVFATQDGKTILDISKDGKITLAPGIRIALNAQKSQKNLTLDISVSGVFAGFLIYQTNLETPITLVSSLSSNQSEAGISIENGGSWNAEVFSDTALNTSLFGYRFFERATIPVLDTYKNTLGGIDGIGMLSEVPGIGWKDKNRMMLSYAGGQTVGEATKWFHTFTFINMGDPVAHNDKKAPGTEQDGVDRSLGQELTSPTASPVVSFAHQDMDRDGYKDIIALHADGYLELFLNLRDKFRSRSNIAYVPDMVEKGMSLGDFSGDGYADILSLNHSGSFILMANQNRKFTRTSLSFESGQTAPQKVSQFKIRDMDADKKDDIVYLTEGGELGILYGGENASVFNKKILDATLGITLSATPEITGGAIFARNIPQISETDLGTNISVEPPTPDESILKGEVFYQYTKDIFASDASEISDVLALENALSGSTNARIPTTQTYVRSQYAPAYNISTKKIFKNISGGSITSGDTVQVMIEIENTANTPLEDIEYLDTIAPIFDASKTEKYTITTGNQSISRDFEFLQNGDFDTHLIVDDIPAFQKVTLSYEVEVLPASYGELLVGDFEIGETGADVYGDVGFKNSNTCGADMLLWRSGPGSREYTRGSRSFSTPALPTSLQDRVADGNSDGIPDSIANMTDAERNAAFEDITRGNSHSSSSGGPIQVTTDTNNRVVDIGFSPGAAQNIDTMAQNLADGLSCGFGGGSCMSFPVNWAPLAPGSAPVVFGYPLSSLVPSTGTPIFSALTCQLLTFTCGTSLCTLGIPSVYPASRMGANFYQVSPGANNGDACKNIPQANGAGGQFGIDSQMNFLRIYMTPTLTLGMGTAVCFGGTARTYGNKPGKALWPLTQGGNCIVTTKPMPVCKDDGSVGDGDVRGVSGLGTLTDAWNAGSCSLSTSNALQSEDKEFFDDVIAYLKNPQTSELTSLYERLSRRGSRTVDSGPLLRMGGGTQNPGLEVGVEIDTAKPLSNTNIVKLKNKRIASFPDFIMEWVTRQTEELTNGLFAAPNLTIIPPTSLGQNGNFDGSFSGFLDTFNSAYSEETLDQVKSAMGEAYNATIQKESATNTLQNRTTSSSSASSDIGKWINTQTRQFERSQDALFANELKGITNNTQGGLSAIRAAYKLIGKLPLISLSERQIPINVPWILPQELDRYARSLDAYKREFDATLKDFCANDQTQECLEKKAKLQSSGFINSLNQNLKIIEQYKNFPAKLQKYVTWKQKYMSEILCNIDSIQQLTSGWLKDNGVRFRKWAELYVLIKSIADSWQPLLDIFATTNAQCGVCTNQRYNAQYYKFKLISAIIPNLPIVRFPRWPDIVLDLHDIRIGLHIAVPNFAFRLNPIRLPDLPALSLPNSPNATLSLPTLPSLPKLPDLPELPSLPSLPKVQLPNLPPPPKIPKIFGSVSSFLSISKLISKLYCYYQKTSLIPEWNVGDVIAQRTERQGTLPMDFLSIQTPNITLQTLKKINVSSHINFEIQSDFLTEFAKSAVEPINEFGADIGRSIPKDIAPDINISTPQNIDIKLDAFLTEGDPVAKIKNLLSEVQKYAHDEMEIDTFIAYIKNEFQQHPETTESIALLDKSLAKAHLQAQDTQNEMLAYNEKRFNILREYIQDQYDETAKMQNIIDLLTKKDDRLSYESLPRNLFVSEEKSVSRVEQFNQEFVLGAFGSQKSISDQDSLIPSRNVLLSRLERLADLTAAPASATSEALSAGYTPNFQGIYILTSGGTQTRLFDYIEPLMGDEQIEVRDVDADGDKDYIFLFDGSLFIKYTSTFAPNPIRDTTIFTHTLDSQDALPTAPNFFDQELANPGRISLAFSPALKKEQKIWRMDFYDAYLEWDMVERGMHDEETVPTRIVEFVQSESNSLSDTPVSRSIEAVSGKETTLITGPKPTILTGALDFTLSKGRKIYTGRDPAVIRLSSDTRKTLLPHRAYAFDDDISVVLERGKVFIFPSLVTESYEYTPDMRGMPLIPGTSLFGGSEGFVIRNHQDERDITVAPGGSYMLKSVGSENDMYYANIDVPNAFYYASLRHEKDRDASSRVTLLSPQKSFDTSAPELDIPESIRLPVYQTLEYSLRDILSETNTYSLGIDEDMTTDANGNGTYDDDFSSTGAFFQTDTSRIVFGPFSTLGNREMNIRITDEFGNQTQKLLEISIYPPVPIITSVSGTGWILGSLDEPLMAEPIDFFRIRPGTEITKINTNSTQTLSEGIFSSGSFFASSGSVLSLSGVKIPISEKGVFSYIPEGYTLEALPASGIQPTRMNLISPRGEIVYTQFFTLPLKTPILDTTKNPTLSGSVLAITPSEKFAYVSATASDPSVPFGGYIVGEKYQPILAIAADGNIYTLSSNTTLRANKKDGFLVLEALNGSQVIASFWYKFDFFYTVK